MALKVSFPMQCSVNMCDQMAVNNWDDSLSELQRSKNCSAYLADATLRVDLYSMCSG